MKAVEFVNRFGWGEARKIVDPKGIYLELAYLARKVHHLNINDLKTLVEAKELVDLYGGLNDARYMLDDPMIDASEAWDLSKAIKLMESVENDQTRD